MRAEWRAEEMVSSVDCLDRYVNWKGSRKWRREECGAWPTVLVDFSVGGKNIVQSVISSCWKANMVIQFEEHSLGVNLVEILSQDEESI